MIFLDSSVVLTLFNITGGNKHVVIDDHTHLEFVDFQFKKTENDSVYYSESRIKGKVIAMSHDSILVEAVNHEHREFNDLNVLFHEKKSITGGAYQYKLKISDLDGAYYSKLKHDKWRTASLSIFGASVFTTLVIAPLLSIQYRSVSLGDSNGFKRNQYFALAGSGLVLAAVSYTCYVSLKPKYYSFAYDDYNPRKKRWKLELSR